MSIDLNSLIMGATSAGYLAAAVGMWRSHDAVWPRLVVVGALILHALLLHDNLFHDGSLQLDLANSISLFMWQCALLVWLVGAVRPLTHLGWILYPLTALAAGLSALQWQTPASEFTGSWPLALHILMSLLAYGVLTIAAVQALFLMMQDRGLRQHNMPTALGRLPPLETMEQLLFQLMAFGFFLLSLALISGLLFVQDLFAQHLVHKTFFSALAWLVFATLLWGRWRFGWRGRKAINWTLGGYMSLLLAYFGSKWVLEVILHTSWN